MGSWKTPTPEQVRRAQSLMTHAEAYRYFFDSLKNPEWLGPLAELGWFRNPPAPIQDPIRRTMAFPIWPESRFLARMSEIPEAKAAVSAIAQAIPETSNVRVHEDLVDIALNLRPADSASLAAKAEEWLLRPYLVGLPEKLADLVVHLAEGGQGKPALALARSLLHVSASDLAQVEREASFSPEVRARFDDWHYERVLEKCVPVLADWVGVAAFDLFSEVLESAVGLARSAGETPPPEDYSYIWRPAIEDHPQNGPHGIKGLLVTAVRDAGERLARADSSVVKQLVEKLDKLPWKIFHRIALHLLRLFPESTRSEVMAHLVDKSRFDDVTVRHEYYLLEQAAFARLSAEEQETILGWVDQGPDLEAYRTWRTENQGTEPPEEDVQRYKSTWQRDRLYPVAASLVGERKRSYDDLIRQLGEPEDPDFHLMRKMTSWVGPTSPKSLEELQSMDLDSLISELKTWQPAESRWMGPSREGLGRDLTSVIAASPERFVAQARRFQELDPTYVRAFFHALEQAVKANHKIEWQHPLELAAWVVDQPREIPDRVPEYPGLDTGWVWTRKAIADLLVVALGASDAAIPIRFHQLVWTVLKPLTDDPDPDSEGDSSDPATASLNTVRGQAMHALVQFGLWLRRPREDPEAEQALNLLPKVVEALDQHLDPEQDRSATVRSVYGYRFPWLLVIDEAWASGQVTRVFPSEPEWEKLRYAAWDAYVVFCPPYDKVFDVLRAEYGREVDRLTEPALEGHRYDPRQRLAEHILTFFWRGKTSLEDEASVISRFFEKAPPTLRAHAITFVGHSLRSTQEELEPILVERLTKLWEKRLEAARSAGSPEDFVEEIAAFGWWFASGKFGDDWAIRQLREVLEFSQKVEPDHVVVERLAELAPSRPLDAVQCLDAIARGDLEGWAPYGWKEPATEIIRIALETGDPKVRVAAEGLIDHLVRRGHRAFAEIARSLPGA